MREIKPFFVLTMCFFSLLGCNGRPPFEDKETPAIDAYHGVFLSQEKVQAPKTQFEDLEIEALIGDGEYLRYRHMDPETLETTEVSIAKIVKIENNWEFIPVADLGQQTAEKPHLRQFSSWAQQGVRLRVILEGSDLKITRIYENHRESTIWKKQDKTAFMAHQGKVQETARSFLEMREAFINTWKEKQFVLFERALSSYAGGQVTRVKVTLGKDLKDEVIPAKDPRNPTEVLKTIINFRRVLAIDKKTAKINEKHDATLSFRMLRQSKEGETRQLYVTIEYNPDADQAKLFTAQPVEGVIEPEGEGFKLTYERRGESKVVRRYQPAGVTLTPTPELGEDDEGATDADENPEVITPSKPKKPKKPVGEKPAEECLPKPEEKPETPEIPDGEIVDGAGLA